MKSQENNGCIDVDEIILPPSKPQKFIGRLPMKKTSKQKMTTFWVSPETWQHVHNQRKLGETVDECLRRIMGIRRHKQMMISAELLSITLQSHLPDFPPNVLIRDVSFDSRLNMASFLLEGDEFPPVPEMAEPESITIAHCSADDQTEVYVRIESEIDVIIERADGKGSPIRLPGGTLDVCEKGLTLIIKKPA